jgi:hypothetical protein
MRHFAARRARLLAVPALAALGPWAALSLSAEPGSPPRLTAVFPVELADTSGEAPRPGHGGRSAAVTAELGDMLAASGRYRPIDLAPIAARLAAAGPLHRCDGCWLSMAHDAGAELAVVTVVHKMSTLVASMHLWVVEVATRRVERKAAVSLRGDTDEAWRRAAAYLVRTRILAEEPARPSLSSPFPGG